MRSEKRLCGNCGSEACYVKCNYYKKDFGTVSHVDSHGHLNGSDAGQLIRERDSVEQGYSIRKGPLNKFSIFPGSGAVMVYFQN